MANFRALTIFLQIIYLFSGQITCNDKKLESRNLIRKSNAVFQNLPVARMGKREKRDSGYAYIESERIEIVESHNNYRSNVNPRAANMKYMSWDYDLENMAQEWAESCIWDYGNPDNTSPYSSIGQNLWLGGSQEPDTTSPMESWYSEASDYNYEDNSCTSGSKCGHYKQIIWATTFKIGCGIAFCATLNSSSSTNAWIVVCNYATAGNFGNSLPYTEGEPCTKCESGIGQCYDDLCRLCSDHDEECECKQVCRNCGERDEEKCKCTCLAGWHGPDCTTVCEDTNDLCGADSGWYDSSTCGVQDSIPDDCPLMCGVCEAAGSITCGDDYEPGCGSQYCANGGTLTSSCDCECTDDYQGDQCLNLKWQAKHGVKILIHASILLYDSLEPKLFEAIVSVLNSYCHDNFEKCCPNSGSKQSSSVLSYVTTDEVETGVGYPTEIAEADYWTMVLVRYGPDNELCNDGSAARKKRSVFSQLMLERVKRDEEDLYVDQGILYNAIVEGETTVESYIGTSVSNIEKATVATGETQVSITWVAAIVVVALLIAFIVGSGIYLYCTRPEEMASLWTQLKDTLTCEKTTTAKDIDLNSSLNLNKLQNGNTLRSNTPEVPTEIIGNNNANIPTIFDDREVTDANSNKKDNGLAKPKRPKSSARKKKKIANRVSSDNLQQFIKPKFPAPQYSKPVETTELPGIPVGDEIASPIGYFDSREPAKIVPSSKLPPLRSQSKSKLPPLSLPGRY